MSIIIYIEEKNRWSAVLVERYSKLGMRVFENIVIWKTDLNLIFVFIERVRTQYDGLIRICAWITERKTAIK